jgi:DNA-binding FadR family transcriptional regulator
MTVALTARKPATNGHRRPTQVTVDRHALVGHVLDWQALTCEAMDANGTALQILCGLERDAAVYEAMRATHDTHARLMQLLTDLRAAAHELDNPTP